MVLATAISLAAATASAAPASFAARISAASFIVMDAETGRVLRGVEVSRRLPPASTTKILTAVIALERLPRGATATISARAAAVRVGTALGVEAGEQWPVDVLLRAMLMTSANDAAVAVAERVADSVERFVRLMNAKAREIGATKSRFANPNGYDAANHYVTAYDLAIITRHAMQHSDFRAIVGAQRHPITRPGRPAEDLVSTNGLLAAYPGADGVKTGMTGNAGRVLVGSATREGWRLIAVAMKSTDPVADVSELLDAAFAAFQRVQVARRGAEAATTAVGPKRRTLVAIVPGDVHAAVRRGASVSSRVWLNPALHAPIRAGAPVGTMRFYEGGQMVAQTPLVAANHVRP
jgi:D-alanyl-D-alanine carboxypeptidase (penicillin-binding protein 5/6)